MSAPGFLAMASAGLALVTPSVAQAYMGPVLGLGALTTILGIFGSLLLGLLSILWYPVKRLWRRWRQGSEREDEQ